MLRLTTMNTPVNLTSRVAARALIPCLLLFTLAMLLSRAPANRNSSLSALLLPTTSCAAPCFLGIRPGVTSVDAGLQALRSDPMIQSIAPIQTTPSSGSTSFMYQVEFAPRFDTLHTAQMQLVTASSTIEDILLTGTGMQLSDIELVFGQPATVILVKPLHTGVVTYASFYPQYQIYIQTVLVECLPKAETVWDRRSDVVIGIASSQKYAEQRDYYPDDADVNREGWQQQLSHMERLDCPQPASDSLFNALEAVV